MATTAVYSPIVPSLDSKALHLYAYRRMAPGPFYVNHTPRDDVIPASEVRKVDAYNARTNDFTSADVPRHLDLNLGAANNCYWSEDEFRKNKTPHFTASTHSRSAPTSPVHERMAFMEPRDAQYTIDHTASEMAHFLKETAPASAVMTRSQMEDNGMLQRETSVKRGRKMKDTARRVLVSGNKRLPSPCQMPCLQPRDSSPVMVQSDMVVEKVSKSGAKYYQIVPEMEDIVTPDSPVSATARRDWVPRHRAVRIESRSGTRSPGRHGKRDRSTHINTAAETDAYGTMSESEGLMFRVPSYQPGTALGDPHYQYIPSRKGSVDSAMALDMARRGSAFSVDSRIADSELTDNEQNHQQSFRDSTSQSAAGPVVRRSMQPRYLRQSPSVSSSPSYTQLAEAARQAPRAANIINKDVPQPVRRSHEEKFQATLASFPAAPSNPPSRQPSVNRVKTASAMENRKEQARARKLRDLQRTRQASVQSTAETVSSDTARISSDASGEPLMDSDLENVMTKGKAPLPKPAMCSHGFNVCPHGCKHGPTGINQHQHLQPEQVAYRQSLALPATPDLSSHPAYRPRQSSDRSGARAPTPSNTSRIDFGSPASIMRPVGPNDNERRLEQENAELKDVLSKATAALNAIAAFHLGGSNSLLQPVAMVQPLPQPGLFAQQPDVSGVAAAAAAGAMAGVQAHAAEISRQNSTTSRKRNDSIVSTATTVSEKHTSAGSGYDSSMTSTEAVWGSSGSFSGFEVPSQPKSNGMNALEVYMSTRKCSLTPPVEEDGREGIF